MEMAFSLCVEFRWCTELYTLSYVKAAQSWFPFQEKE
jgi:hypothetical protein